jgi:hypothetical protein
MPLLNRNHILMVLGLCCILTSGVEAATSKTTSKSYGKKYSSKKKSRKYSKRSKKKRRYKKKRKKLTASSLQVQKVKASQSAAQTTGDLSGLGMDKKPGFNGNVEFQNNRLVGTSVGQEEGNKYFSGISLSYHDEPKDGFRKDFDFAARYTDAYSLLYSVQEANVSYTIDSGAGKHQGKLGRMTLDWSDFDTRWGLGMINNRQNFTLYETGLEGLAGLSYTYKRGNFRLNGFASMLNIPELNPGMEVEDGKIISKSPWVNNPPASIKFNGQDVDMYYYLEMPEMQDIVFRYSVGLEARYESKSALVNAFALRKTEPTPRVTGEGALNPDKGIVEAEIRPEFVHQTIVGGQVAYKWRDYKFALNSINDIPDNLPPLVEGDNITIYDERSPRYFVGAGFDKTNDETSLGANYFQLLNPEEKLEYETVKQRFVRAINVYYSSVFFDKFNFKFDYKYDLDTKDELVQGETSFRIGSSAELALGLAWIAAPSEDSFWSPFRTNDIAYSSLRYHF